MAFNAPLPFRGLPDNPFLSGTPMIGDGERVLHAAMQSVYAHRVRTYFTEIYSSFTVPTSPLVRGRSVYVDTAVLQVVRRWPITINRGITQIEVGIRLWAPAAGRDRAVLVEARLRTLTFATPPVASVTGATITTSVRGQAEVLLRIAPDLAVTRDQMLYLDLGLAAGEPLSRVDLVAAVGWETPLLSLG